MEIIYQLEEEYFIILATNISILEQIIYQPCKRTRVLSFLN